MLKVAPAPARTSPARAPASPGRVRPSRVTETPARIRLNSRTVVQSRGAVFIYPFRDSPQTLLQLKGGGLATDSEIAKHDNAAKSVAGFISHRGSSFRHLTRNQLIRRFIFVSDVTNCLCRNRTTFRRPHVPLQIDHFVTKIRSQPRQQQQISTFAKCRKVKSRFGLAWSRAVLRP